MSTDLAPVAAVAPFGPAPAPTVAPPQPARPAPAPVPSQSPTFDAEWNDATNSYIVRFVDPVSGQVVAQLPPEGVVAMVAELLARETAGR